MLSETWFKIKNIDNFPGYKGFNSVHAKKNCGLQIFCINDLTFKALEVSDLNTEVIEHAHVKLHNLDKKIFILADNYRSLSHGVWTRFLFEVEKNYQHIFQ